MLAAGCGRAEDLQRLITALTEKRAPSVIQAIVRSNPPLLREKDPDGWLPLHHAVFREAPVEVVQCLVDGFEKALQESTDKGWHPLSIAARHNAPLEVVHFLVSKRPQLLREASRGFLPLHRAAGFGSLEVVRCLVGGWEQALHERSCDGKLPVDMALEYNKEHPNVAAWLRAATDGRWVEHCLPAASAVETGDWLRLYKALKEKRPLAEIQAIVRTNPSLLRSQNSNGRLPLHDAVYIQSSEEIVKYLVDGWEQAVQVKDEKGWLPLHLAADNMAQLTVLQCLVRKWERALQESVNGWLPLHLAVRNEAPVQTIQYLLDTYESALQQKTSDGWLPLHLAARYEVPVEVVKLLVHKYPDALQERRGGNWLPLHLAAQFRSVPVVECLLEGWEQALWEETKEGELPVHLARSRNEKHPEVVSFLEAATQARLENRLPATAPTACDPHGQDRDRLRNAIEYSSHAPARVSGAYVTSILTDTILGDGFFGTVFKGVDAALPQEFAIKSIKNETLQGSKEDIEKAMKTFKTEQEVWRHRRISLDVPKGT
jgi:ankyrin repeat protein